MGVQPIEVIMALIEISTVATDTIDVANDYIPFVDVSETPDGTNKATFASIFGQNLVDIRALADPNADRLLFWDDSAGAYTHLTLGTNLSITGTTINAAGGGIGGSTGATDNAILRADGTGGATAQSTGVTIDDSNNISLGSGTSITGLGASLQLAFGTLSIVALSSGQVAFGDSGALWGTIAAAGLSIDTGYLQLDEQTAPAAPAANGMRTWIEDNGSGKTRWMCQFGSGVAQQLSIEP